MIALALAFLAGGIAMCFVPDRVQGWVRGAGAALYRFVMPDRAKFVRQPLYGEPMVVERVDIGRAILNLLGFLWRWKWALLAVVLFFGIGGMLRGCVPFHFGESREHAQIRADLAQEETRTQVRINARDTAIGDIRAHVAIARVTLQHLQEQGHAEIAAVTPAGEEPLPANIVAAWRANIDRLCEFPRRDGSFPDTCRTGDPS